MSDVLLTGIGKAQKFSTISIDTTAKLVTNCAMAGYGWLLPHTDYDSVGLVLFIGTNPMVSHGHITRMFNPAANIRGVTKRGGEVWTIDPLHTETAKFSTHHIQPWPGKDYAVLAWLVREILDGGPLDLAQPVEGMDRLREALKDYDLATAAGIAGVSEADLTCLLAAIRRVGHVTIETGTGTGMSQGMNMTQWLANVLVILTGRMNRRGGLWFHPGFVRPIENLSALPVTFDPFGPGPASRPELPTLMGETPCAALPSEIFAGNIRALVNFSGGLMRTLPDTNVLEKALTTLDVFANFDVTANDTTALSTHLMPTKDQLERSDLAMTDILARNVSMQYAPAVVPPLGQRRSGWWIISQICRRMGLAVPDHVPQDDSEPDVDDFMLSKLLPEGSRCKFNQVKATGYAEVETDFPAKWFDDHIERIGGWKLAPDILLGQWSEKLAEDIAELGQPRPLCYVSRRQRRKMNSCMDVMRQPADILIHPEDAAAHGIGDGQMVRVYNGNGEIILVARLDAGMRRGVTSIPHGHGSANVNRLTSSRDKIDRLGGMAHFSGVEIQLEPVQP
jgi:anaerobic selenocysteine-containing dehydrogenase